MNQDRYATNKWNDRNRNRNMALTEAKQEQLLNGCNSLERKVFDHVPIQEAWDAKEINRLFHASGQSSEHHRLRAALGGLKDKGLVREMRRDHFQRTAVKIRELREPVERERPSVPKLGDSIDVNALRRAVVSPAQSKPDVTPATPKAEAPTCAPSAPEKPTAAPEAPTAVAVKEPQTTQGEVPMAAPTEAAAKSTPESDVAAQLLVLTDEVNRIAKSSNSKLAQLAELATQIAEETVDQLNLLTDKIEGISVQMEDRIAISPKEWKKFQNWKALIASLSEDD